MAYHDDYLAYDFGLYNALREERLFLAKKMIHSYGLVGPSGAVESEPALPIDDEISTVHDKSYLQVLKKLSKDPRGFSFSHGLGIADNPVFMGMYEAAAIQVGGTILACDSVARHESDRALNMGGGFHHALPKRASGFCLLNDVAIGIKRLLNEHKFKRIMYVDIDVHHSDGVEEIFLEDPKVLKVSLHEDGHYLFPGTGAVDDIGKGSGEGYTINVPLPPYTGDVSYLHAFRKIVMPLAESFKPEVLFTQLGVDAHYADPLAHLNLSTRAYEQVGEALDQISSRFCKSRWVAVTGGGYDIMTCARLWTLMFSKMMGRDLDNTIPMDWMEYCRTAYTSVPEEGALRDPPSATGESTVSRAVAKVVEEVKKKTFKYHGLR